MVAKEQDLDTKLAELLAGAPGGSSTAHGQAEFVHCFGGMAPAGSGSGGLGFEASLWPWGERVELWDCSFSRLARSSRAVCVG